LHSVCEQVNLCFNFFRTGTKANIIRPRKPLSKADYRKWRLKISLQITSSVLSNHISATQNFFDSVYVVNTWASSAHARRQPLFLITGKESNFASKKRKRKSMSKWNYPYSSFICFIGSIQIHSTIVYNIFRCNSNGAKYLETLWPSFTFPSISSLYQEISEISEMSNQSKQVGCYL